MIARADGDRWAIVERDATGAVIGTAYRDADGGKDFAKGGKRGLILPWPLAPYAGTTEAAPVYLCEGASDTAALLALSLDAVGVPMAGYCGELLAGLLAGRHVVIVADADDAGRRGAAKIAAALVSVCASVRTIEPPDGAKDARAAVIAGADARAFGELVAKAERFAPVADLTDGAPIVVRMADVEAKPVDWLWRGRIPRRCVTVLAGRPGDGKSFATADWAARVSTGRAWPDGTPCEAGDVLLVSGEDDPETTLRPRLDAHGADVERVHLLRAVHRVALNGKTGQTMFTLADMAALETALKGLQTPRLCIIDPIGSFLGGKVDAHRDNEVRAVLAPIAMLAERYGIAVLVVAHHNKSNAGHADDLILGSRAFTGLARAVLHLMRDPEDEDRRLLLPGKVNIARKPAGLAFRIDGDPARLTWESGPVDLNADGVLAAMAGRGGDGTRDEAREWLRDVLSPGPQPAADVKERAGADGIKPRTLDRAKADLGVKATREGYGSAGRWMWYMPHSAPTPPKDAKPEGLAHNGDGGAQRDARDGWGEL